jgi:hypothetical protein
MDTNSLHEIERVVNMLMAKKREDTRQKYLEQDTHAIVGILDTFNIRRWKEMEIPSHDEKDDPIDTPRDKVWAMNNLILRGNKGKAKTYNDFPVDYPVPIPDGAFVFNPINTGYEKEARGQLKKLFRDEHYHPTTGITGRRGIGLRFLFLAAPKSRAIYMPQVLRTLAHLQYTELHEFITQHYSAIKHTAGATDDDINTCSLTFVKYDIGVGLTAHIDGIEDFGDTFGPIFTIAMSRGQKMLDLLPIATETGNTAPPVRLITRQFQITMLQGCARAAYAHSIPFGSSEEQYTIAFKFPALTSGTPGPVYHCSKLDAYIPTIIPRTSD